MGALLSPCRSPGVDEDYDDGTDNDRGEPVDDDRGESELGLRADHVDAREARVGLASLAVDLP